MNSSEDAIVVSSHDGTIVNLNAEAERLYGYPAHEVTGKSQIILIPKDRLHEYKGVLNRVRCGEIV